MDQNVKGSVIKHIRSSLANIIASVNSVSQHQLTTLPLRPWNKKTEYPGIKWHMIGSRPPTLKNNRMWKRQTDFLFAIFTNEYQSALAQYIVDEFLLELGFDMGKGLYETYIDKLDYVNKALNNNELLKLDDMHIWLEKIESGPITEPSETHIQIFIKVYHN